MGGINGVVMFAFGFVLFFNHRSLIAGSEGRHAADSKTVFDVMIWRIVGLWVSMVGLTCLLAADLPGGLWSSLWGFGPNALQAMWPPLCFMLFFFHTVETGIKRAAVGSRFWSAASGNIVLGLIALAALLVPELPGEPPGTSAE